MTLAIVFPGQGSQTVGMGKDLFDAFPVARKVFAEVDEALGQSLSRIMFDGPDNELMLTENAQPALLTCSMATLRVIESEGEKLITSNKVDYVAGHSLGEYSALCAAGAFSLTDAVKLVRTRGRAMQNAVPIGEGAMIAILGIEPAEASVIAAEAACSDVCNFANDNAPGQVVLSGSIEAIKRAEVISKVKGAKRSIILPVSAPFHSSLMLPAANVMRLALDDCRMNNPVVPLISNITAKSISESGEIKRLLVEQVCGRIRWRESVLNMIQNGVDSIVELGNGKTLSGMIRRIDKTITTKSIGSSNEVGNFLEN